jgi:hypothetical protein
MVRRHLASVVGNVAKIPSTQGVGFSEFPSHCQSIRSDPSQMAPQRLACGLNVLIQKCSYDNLVFLLVDSGSRATGKIPFGLIQIADALLE